MKKIFLFLVVIVFVLVGYGLSEARKYKVSCNTTVYETWVGINILNVRGLKPLSLGKKNEKGRFPYYIEIKTKDGKIKKYLRQAKYKIRNNYLDFGMSNQCLVCPDGIKKDIPAVKKFEETFGETPEVNCYVKSEVINFVSLPSENTNDTAVSSGSGNKLLQSIKEQLDRLEKKLNFIEKKLAFIGIE